MLSCLGQFCWRDLLHRAMGKALGYCLGCALICAAVAMCLECDGSKEHDKKNAEGMEV